MSEKSRYSHCRIFLRQIRFLCKIGIDPAEQEVCQTLLLDVEIIPSAAAGDAQPAIDYAAVLARLGVFADSKQHLLMEHFAHEAADIILSEFAAQKVTVTCRKPSPFSNLEEAAVEVTLSLDE